MSTAAARTILVVALAAALMPSRMSSQTFTLKTTTEVVLVNVTARDKNGMFVKDLKADDFTVLEDGKKQTILSIDAENTDSVVSAESPKEPVLRLTPAQPATADKPPATAPLQENDLKDRRLIVLFFDLGSMQPQEVDRGVKSALDYVNKQMAPADLVSVLTLSNSLSLAQDFTSDKEQLQTVLTALDTGSNQGLGDADAADTTGDNSDTSTDTASAFTPDETEYNIFNTDQ